MDLLKLVLSHPLNRPNRVFAASRWAGWQAWKAVVRRPVTVRIWKNLRVRVYPDWPYSWTALYMKLAEYDEMMFTLRYLRSGESFIDVGANIGFYTLLASSVNQGAPVLAFEPHPTASARLRENVRLNRLDNVYVVEAAIGDVAGSSRLTTNLFDENRITMEEMVDSATVPLVTLDGELRRNGVEVSSVGLVKVDTEGFESHVLRGAGTLLEAVPGPVWIVELAGLGTRYGSDDAEVRAVFEQHGYSSMRYEAADNNLTTLEAKDTVRGNVIFARDPAKVLERLGKPRPLPVLVPEPA